MKITSRFITNTYFVMDDIYIDLVSDLHENTFDAYMYSVEYGTKYHMIGVDQSYDSYEDFKELVESNIDDYVVLFRRLINE